MAAGARELARDAVEPGWGNKAISLKLCRNVLIRDISILRGGHFAILATGVDNFTIDNLKIDTNRDGIDVDAIGSRYGVDVWARFGRELAPFLDAGLAGREGSRLWLTRQGMLLAHEVMAVFV